MCGFSVADLDINRCYDYIGIFNSSFSSVPGGIQSGNFRNWAGYADCQRYFLESLEKRGEQG